MIKNLLLSSVVLVAAVCAGYYHFFYPPNLYKRAVQKSYDGFIQASNSKDRAKVGAALQEFLTDDAKIRLQVGFFSITQPDGGKMSVQDFDKPTFISFVDNVLYPLSDFGYSGEITAFHLAPDKKSASVTMDSTGWADGISYYGGTGIGMRFTAETTCQGQVVFDGMNATLAQSDCTMKIASIPHPDEISKLHDPDTLREMLTTHP